MGAETRLTDAKCCDVDPDSRSVCIMLVHSNDWRGHDSEHSLESQVLYWYRVAAPGRRLRLLDMLYFCFIKVQRRQQHLLH
jgi:hypothetical protein